MTTTATATAASPLPASAAASPSSSTALRSTGVARLEVRSLRKTYGEQVAVDDLSFTCEPGTVTGFLGPNGAGKSTTLKILTGLASATSGEAFIGGMPYRELPAPARTVGVMLDARALHGGRTGIETLRLAARAAGVGPERAQETLERVGLAGAAKKRVAGYSYGMRQRLGIGVALVGEPVALILDEPANGLDPDGIRWMRRTLRTFADAGGTVLLSSHQLAEVQATADRVLVIARGRLVRDGSLADLAVPTGTRVTATEPQRLREAAISLGIDGISHDDGSIELPLDPADVGRMALEHRLVLTGLRSVADSTLEDVFFALTDSAGQEA